MKTDRAINLVGHFLKQLGAELEQSDSAPSPSQEAGPINFEVPPVWNDDGSFRGVQVGRDTTLIFDANDPRTDVDLATLRHSLSRASEHAEEIYTRLDDLDTNVFETREEKRAITTSMRLAKTISDGFEQIVLLLDGKVLGDPPPREFEDNDVAYGKASFVSGVNLSPNHPASGNLSEEEFEESGYNGPMVTPDEIITPGPSVITSANALFLAEIYQDLKTVKGEVIGHGPSPSLTASRLDDVMNKIKDRTEKGHA